jgi:hypothetical protein
LSFRRLGPYLLLVAVVVAVVVFADQFPSLMPLEWDAKRKLGRRHEAAQWFRDGCSDHRLGQLRRHLFDHRDVDMGPEAGGPAAATSGPVRLGAEHGSV